ncbi:signal peptidase complex [Ophiostoma piceae UAMH 11346]|uniref:Signal peptidase complex subunit 2 n=1 Tax=Ophiostoma piceae (strain UAMH 11346) TaxID=1262450 RepID=S3C8H1_OPHP1|nr:signal peptidase complex [Ophiostoma piceae UAMH 11346]
MSQQKISVYSLADLKNTSDDAIPNYLNSLGFKQSHTLTDIRLGLGFSSLAVAAACFVWDLKLGFYDTKYYSLAAVVAYALLNLAISHFTTVQGNNIYEATAPNGETIHISTTSPKYTPVYQVEVTVTSKDGKKSTVEFKRPFSEWFDSVGHFVAIPFQTILATNVPVIGTADPKRVAAAPSASPQYSAAMLDMLAAASTPADASGAESDAATATGTSSGKKGGKRRKV